MQYQPLHFINLSGRAPWHARHTMPQSQPLNQPTFPCRSCDSIFKRPDHRARHERSHRNLRPFRCGICSRSFGRRDILLRHAAHVHQGREVLEYLEEQPQERDILTSSSKESSSSVDRSLSSPIESSLLRDTGLTLHLTDVAHVEQDKEAPEYLLEQPQETAIWTSSPKTSFLSTGRSQSNTTGPSPPEDTEMSGDYSDTFAGPKLDLAHLTALEEPDLDRLLASLPAIHSYTDLARLLQQKHIPHVHQLNNNLLYTSHVRTHEIPSIHHNLFPTTNHQLIKRSLFSTSPLYGLLDRSTFDRLVGLYKHHYAAIFPFLHFPTLDLSIELPNEFGFVKNDMACSTQGFCNAWKRKPHPTLVLSILVVGAIYDHNSKLARELYHITGKQLLKWLTQTRDGNPTGPPPLDLIQALLNYVSFGVSFGDESIERLTIGHAISLGALIKTAGLEKRSSGDSIYVPAPCKSCNTTPPVHWLDWSVREERKRALFAFSALMSSALTYLENVPSVYWRDIEQAMPCSDDTWKAETCEVWGVWFQETPPEPLFCAQLDAMFRKTNTKDHDTERSTTIPADKTGGAHNSDDSWQISLASPFTCFTIIASIHADIWQKKWQGTTDTEATKLALKRWQNMWLQLSLQSETSNLHPLVGCCLSMFDNSQLLLHVDVTEAKEYLSSRNYDRFCVTLRNLDLKLDSDGPGCSLSENRMEVERQVDDIYFNSARHKAFRQVALYSVNALEMTFKSNPWWKSGSTAKDIPLQAGIAIFYCSQILSIWLCYFCNCFREGLYTNMCDSEERTEDACLVEKIIMYAGNRKLQFKAHFAVPSLSVALKETAVAELACDLLVFHSHALQQSETWPAFVHLSKALKRRSITIFK
ncbi:hypothetical protein EDB81DRAFT_809061 [Dactylonectria macrodidyma]|uniref:C2H2-type domain-containing protein n=1 Tax=Dactylonectria macrodidyma TaxID=307937 RepID=A0A9P9IQB4_9HYPO|nr:hypothetical protein EDB81DRAFT_809061 [Dactylonectria macrodidyma]